MVGKKLINTILAIKKKNNKNRRKITYSLDFFNRLMEYTLFQKGQKIIAESVVSGWFIHLSDLPKSTISRYLNVYIKFTTIICV